MPTIEFQPNLVVDEVDELRAAALDEVREAALGCPADRLLGARAVGDRGGDLVAQFGVAGEVGVRLADRGLVLAGIVGSGKSALAKSLYTRSIPFGRRVYVPGDPKGEHTAVAEAVGRTERFLKVHQEYSKAPEVTRKRMFLETMERVLGKTDKIIIDSGAASSGVVPYLPLNELNRSTPRTEGGAR